MHSEESPKIAMIIPGPYADYPPRWATFDQHIVHFGTGAFLFSCTPGHVNRFAARYKVAKCFRSAVFEGMSQDSAVSYTALVHLLLTYAAFEHMLRCVNVAMADSAALLSPEEMTTLGANIRKLEGQAEVFKSLRPHVNKTYQGQIDTHLQGGVCNAWYLAGGMRHGFAHGLLTATPANVPGQAVARVADLLRKTLFSVMDREFSNRMEQFEKSIG